MAPHSPFSLKSATTWSSSLGIVWRSNKSGRCPWYAQAAAAKSAPSKQYAVRSLTRRRGDMYVSPLSSKLIGSLSRKSWIFFAVVSLAKILRSEGESAARILSLYIGTVYKRPYRGDKCIDG